MSGFCFLSHSQYSFIPCSMMMNGYWPVEPAETEMGLGAGLSVWEVHWVARLRKALCGRPMRVSIAGTIQKTDFLFKILN
jgi:hypothetical protein